MASIALFGATGMIGSRIMREALERGHRLLAVTRDPSRLEPGPDLVVDQGDVTRVEDVVEAVRGQDVVISAVGGGDGPGHERLMVPATKALIAGIRDTDRTIRFIMVGGAGSLRLPDGTQLWDSPDVPDAALQIMRSHGDALAFLRTVSDVAWVNISPSAQIAPGERTAAYRTASEDLLMDAEGASRISAEDYAVAVLDEVENSTHFQERFTVGY